MPFGLGKLMKKAAGKTASTALKVGMNAATGGLGNELIGSALNKVKDKRIDQVKNALVQVQNKTKLVAFAKLAEDALALGRFVKAAREDGIVTDEERDAILNAIEELSDNALKTMKNLVD